jgi:hypothetical protein
VQAIRLNEFSDLRRGEYGLLPDSLEKWLIVAIWGLLTLMAKFKAI